MLGRKQESLLKSRIKTNLALRDKRDQVRQAVKEQEKNSKHRYVQHCTASMHQCIAFNATPPMLAAITTIFKKGHEKQKVTLGTLTESTFQMCEVVQ